MPQADTIVLVVLVFAILISVKLAAPAVPMLLVALVRYRKAAQRS